MSDETLNAELNLCYSRIGQLTCTVTKLNNSLAEAVQAIKNNVVRIESITKSIESINELL